MLRVEFDNITFMKSTHVIHNRVIWVRITENKLVFVTIDEHIFEYPLKHVLDLLITHTHAN